MRRRPSSYAEDIDLVGNGRLAVRNRRQDTIGVAVVVLLSFLLSGASSRFPHAAFQPSSVMMVPAVRKRTPSILALMLVVEPLASGINAAMKRRAIISNRFSASEPRRRISTHSSVGMMPW